MVCGVYVIEQISNGINGSHMPHDETLWTLLSGPASYHSKELHERHQLCTEATKYLLSSNVRGRGKNERSTLYFSLFFVCVACAIIILAVHTECHCPYSGKYNYLGEKSMSI